MNNSQFRLRKDIEVLSLPFGTIRWISQPVTTGARQLTMLEGNLIAGDGHSFHKHPDQEEIMYVVSGQVEQWLETERRILGPGDAVFIPPGIVHASFNAGTDDARLLAIFSPCRGEGFESIELGGTAPWSELRKTAQRSMAS